MEQAQRELEEYQKLKEAFTVEGEGCEVIENEEEQNLLEQFITHIRVSLKLGHFLLVIQSTDYCIFKFDSVLF